MTVHHCLHGEAPRYLADLISPSAAATGLTSGPPRLALLQCHVPRHHSVTARSLWLCCQVHSIDIFISLCPGLLAFLFFSFYFQLHAVRRPRVSRTYVAVILTFWFDLIWYKYTHLDWSWCSGENVLFCALQHSVELENALFSINLDYSNKRTKFKIMSVQRDVSTQVCQWQNM